MESSDLHSDDGTSPVASLLPLASASQQPYVSELLSFTLDRLHKEPELLRVDAERIRRQMQEVAVGNYRAFISAADALRSIKVEVSSIDKHLESLVNDTVATLAGARYWDDDVMVAVILGTGTNACYVESVGAIPKLQTHGSKSGRTIVNTEWGAFSNGLPLTEFDREMDADSINPGEQNEYYSCDAIYRNWLKVELENSEVPHLEISVEEEDLAFKAAKETLESSLLFLKRKEQNSWLASIEDHIYESNEPVYLELHATAILCQPSGDCMCPDATLLTPLMSSLYSSVSEEEVLKRKLMVGHCDGGIVQVHERGWLGTRKWNFRKSANLRLVVALCTEEAQVILGDVETNILLILVVYC